MKLLKLNRPVYLTASLPTRGAWIEIRSSSSAKSTSKSLPTRGAWIEMAERATDYYSPTSLPTRGAWIEILSKLKQDEIVFSRSPHGERGLKFGLSSSLSCI